MKRARKREKRGWHKNWFKNKEDTIMAKDPVCGMNVDEEAAAGNSVHKGKTYYFCCSGCKAKFEKEPDKYAKG